MAPRALVYQTPPRTKRGRFSYVPRPIRFSVPLNNQEFKWYDETLGFATVTTGGSVRQNSVCEIANGSGESERGGRKITLKSIHIRYVAKIPATATSTLTDDGLRLVVFLDRQANGATATVTDILETAGYLSYNNLSNKSRFRVLYDEYTDISATSGAGNGTTNLYGEHAVTKQWHYRCNIPIEFSSTTGAISEIRSNNVGVLVISDNGTIQAKWTSRVRFTDN